MRGPRHTLQNTKDLREEQRRETKPFRGGELIVIDGPHSGLRVRVVEGVMTIGRHEGNHVPLTLDRGVSRRHAVVEWEGQCLYLRDLSSTNGTYVNGVLAQGRVVLGDLDVITVGRSIIQVVFEEPSSSPVYELRDHSETDGPPSG